MMNFIDISSWQRGLDLKVLYRENPIDGVIVKSTGGVSHVQDTCDAWVQWLIAKGKPWGFYHFLDDDSRHSSGQAEAEWFVKNTRNYFGLGMPFADYEGYAKTRGTAYLKEFLDTVFALTGVRAGVYCSLSVVQEQNFTEIAKNHPLWVAQYANYNRVDGFLDKPWQSGSVKPFDHYVLHQYTSMGYLNGYNGRLDFDQFYGTMSDWKALLEGKTPEVRKADPKVVMDVLLNKYGCGEDRVKNLTEAGYDAQDVQNKVNELYAISVSCKKYVLGNEEYLDSIARIINNL